MNISGTHSLPLQITRFSWKAKDLRMNIVNELLQNIRFLKFYGWGGQFCFRGCMDELR